VIWIALQQIPSEVDWMQSLKQPECRCRLLPSLVA